MFLAIIYGLYAGIWELLPSEKAANNFFPFSDKIHARVFPFPVNIGRANK